MGPDGPGTAPTLQPAQPAPPSVTGTGPGAIPTPPQAAGGGQLGDSLRNLQQYLQNQNFNNPRGGQGPQDPLIQFDSKGVDFGPWLRRFKVKVENNWIIPQAALTNRGRVILQFIVHRDGRITDLKIVQAANPALTSAAVNAITMSSPTLPLPEEYPADFVLFTVTFHYNER